MKKLLLALSLMTMLIAGCGQSNVSSTSSTGSKEVVETKKESPSQLKPYGVALYYLGEARVVQDLITGDLVLSTVEHAYGGRNPVYVLYKSREDMSPQTIESLKKLGYKDPFEK